MSKNNGEYDNVSTFNFANLITLLGFILTVWSIILRIRGAHGILTLTLIPVIAFTDLADGYIARKFKRKTWFGSNFDKLRDKFLALSHSWFMLKSYIELLEAALLSASFIITLLVIMGILESILLVAGLAGIILVFIAWLRGTKAKKIDSNIWGKWKMTLQCVLLFTWACFHDLGYKLDSNLAVALVSLLLIASIVLAWKSIGGYWDAYFPKNTQSKEA